MIGPNTLPMPPVPRRCTTNRHEQDDARRAGRRSLSNADVATSKPSTALSTEIAGVMMPSPYSSAVPNTPSITEAGRAAAGVGLAA